LIAHEFSRVYATDRLPADGADFRIGAEAGEREALARRFELVALDRLEARGQVIRRTPGGLVEVTGRLSASAIQRCVVTLEPIPSEIEADFQRFFAPALEPTAEIEIDPDDILLEPLEGEIVDVGEIVAEELSLALDPYPRAAGAAPGPTAEASERGPFAALAALRRH
jgi:uncharacterized metal-binding protein YceD (DUF177 family)